MTDHGRVIDDPPFHIADQQFDGTPVRGGVIDDQNDLFQKSALIIQHHRSRAAIAFFVDGKGIVGFGA